MKGAVSTRVGIKNLLEETGTRKCGYPFKIREKSVHGGVMGEGA